MVDFVIFAVLAVILGAAVIYLVKAKKRGVKCIGCPDAAVCAHKNGSCSGGGCSCCGDE